MSTSVRLVSFRRDDEYLYREYLAIKYRVFVVEHGWTDLAAGEGVGLAREDPYDAHGRFVIARGVDDTALGVVRGIPLREGFPHAELFEHHMHAPEVCQMRDWLCTMNALAVLPEYRAAKCQVIERGWAAGVGTLLMLMVCRSMEGEGMRGVLATAGGSVSARFCRRFGFVLIDRPRLTSLHPALPMTNIGLVFGLGAHRRREEECGLGVEEHSPAGMDAIELLRYFERREADVLESGDFDSLFPPR
jgi:hypothetical protein